eukprot:COSAG01_NODE_33422_length_564_cov_1.311828_1_plen_62_part_01
MSSACGNIDHRRSSASFGSLMALQCLDFSDNRLTTLLTCTCELRVADGTPYVGGYCAVQVVL